METTGKLEQIMVVGKPLPTDPAQAMLERMALIQIEAAIEHRAQMEIAKEMAGLVPGRTAYQVTRYLCRQTASHYTLAFTDPRWQMRLRPNQVMLAEIGKGVAESVAAMHVQAATEEKAATNPTLQ